MMVVSRGDEKGYQDLSETRNHQEPLLSVFMWGVNHSLSELLHVPPPGLLMPDDFKVIRCITERFYPDYSIRNCSS